MPLSPEDLKSLRYAKSLLENPSLAARVTSAIGGPLERGFKLLPKTVSDEINHATTKALNTALKVAIATLGEEKSGAAANLFHKALAVASGAGGGAFGIAALPIELPVSITIMLRSIADIARSEGEQIRSVESRLACIEVFALGGRAKEDDGSNTGYFTVRAALAKSLAEAASFIAERGIAQESAPAIVRFISQISTRFGVTVSEKLAAQAVPLLGAVGGGLINLLFIDHFQDMARGHFTVRRLERAYGEQIVREAYEQG